MRYKFVKSLWPYGVLVLLCVVVGYVFTLHNISGYNVYPDSYQSVTVAQNLKEYHRLAAPMGQYGLVYPDFFGWTRPLFPALIVLFSFFGMSLFTAAHLIAVIAGVLAIIVVYLLARRAYAYVGTFKPFKKPGSARKLVFKARPSYWRNI
jgi:asparagine N-glycosylation enzyme membrane subunit Stt3